MGIRGVAWKFGDYISTDLIAPGRFAHLRSDLPKLAEHVLEDADENFASATMKKDKTYIVVAGRNFGQGSSREHAARIIKLAGVPGQMASITRPEGRGGRRRTLGYVEDRRRPRTT